VRELVRRRHLVTFFNDLRVQPVGWRPERTSRRDEPALDAAAGQIQAAEYFGTLGFFPGYDARLADPLTAAVKTAWEDTLAAADAAGFDPTAAARRVAAAEAAQSATHSPPTGRTRGEWLRAAWLGDD